MELVHCPNCDTFNPPGSSFCQQCHKPIPEAVDEVPSIPLKPDTETEEPKPVATVEPPPFVASPEVLSRLEQLQKSLTEKPDAKALYLQLTQIYVDGGRKDLAIATLERFLEVEPENVYVRNRIDLLKRPATSVSAVQPSRAAGPRGRATRHPRRPMPSGPLDRAREWVRRRPMLAALAAAGFLSLLIFGISLLMPSARQIAAGDFEAFGAQWSPTGKHLAFLINQNRNTQLAVYDMQSGSHRILDDVYGWGTSTYAWSPNGLRIAYASPSEEDDWQPMISVANILTGETQKVTSGSDPVWYIDDTTLLVRCSSSALGSEYRWSEEWALPFFGLCRVNAVTGESQRAIDIDAWNMSFSPTMEMIAFEKIEQSEDAGSFFTDKETEFEEFVGAVVADNPTNFAQGRRDLSRELEARRFMEEKRASADAESLPFSSDLFVVSLYGGDPTQLTRNGRSSLISWTPDHRRILYSTVGPMGTEVGTMNPDGSDRRIVIDASLQPVQPSSAEITRDGKYVLFVSPVEADEGIATIMTGESPADLHVARIGSSSAKRLENQHPFKQRFALSPDGKRLVYEVLEDVRVLHGQERRELWMMSR